MDGTASLLICGILDSTRSCALGSLFVGGFDLFFGQRRGTLDGMEEGHGDI